MNLPSQLLENLKGALPPALRLLLACSRTDLAEPEKQTARELLGLIDWSEFIRLGIHHNVLGLAYSQLNRHFQGQIPESALKEMREVIDENLVSNLHLTRELLFLLGEFRQAGLAVIPFKGPSLTVAVYRDLSARRFTDLDILIRPQDFAAVKQVLLNLGYLPDPILTPGQERLLVSQFNELPFRHPGKEVMLDVQWRVRPAYCGELDYPGFWNRQASVAIAAAVVPALSAEDLLLVLCVHGEKHCWSHLELVCGVNELIRQSPGLDWNLLLSAATRWRVRRRLFIGLVLAAKLFECPLPDAVLQEMQTDPNSCLLAGEAVTRWSAGVVTAPGPVQAWNWQRNTRERAADRWRFLLGGMFTPTVMDWKTIPLPDRLLPLYVFLRPVRWLGKKCLPAK